MNTAQLIDSPGTTRACRGIRSMRNLVSDTITRILVDETTEHPLPLPEPVRTEALNDLHWRLGRLDMLLSLNGDTPYPVEIETAMWAVDMATTAARDYATHGGGVWCMEVRDYYDIGHHDDI